MRKLYPYNKFINEGIRDKMTPKSEDDLLNYVMGLTKEELDLFLVKSVLEQQIPLIKIALRAGANPNTLDPKTNLSVLYRAVVGGITSHPNKEVIKLLLDAGADPTLPSKRGFVPLNHAKTWNKDIYDFLQEYIKTNESLRDKMTPKSESDIDDAFEKIAEEVADILLNSYDYDDYYNAYEWAIDHKERIIELMEDKDDIAEIVDIILYGYADTDTNTLWHNDTNESLRDKMSPKTKEDIDKKLGLSRMSQVDKLDNAIDYEIDWLVKSLIDEGLLTQADINRALQRASYKGSVEVVKMLIDAGANVHTEYDNALIGASQKGHIEVVKILLDAGADPTTLANRAYMLAGSNGHIEVTRLLKQAMNKKVNESLRDKMTPKSKEDIESELEEMEPFERMTTIFNQHMDDNYMGIKPYYSQEEIDRLIPDYIDTCNHIFDIYEKIEHLDYYYNLSVLIRQELKKDLMTLSPSEQIQYVHDLEYLGGLYTDKEWADLGIRAKKNINESVRDEMTPKSDIELRKSIKKMSKKDKNNLLYKYINELDFDMIKFLVENGADVQIADNISMLQRYQMHKAKEIRELVNKYREERKPINKLKRFLSFNESVRDKMIPKSEQEVQDVIGDLVPQAKLDAAVINGVESIVKKAIDEGADVNRLDKNSFNKACHNGHSGVIKILIDNGFDFHYSKEFAMRSSVWSNRTDIVEILLESGADVHADDDNAIGAAVENYILQDTPIDMIKLLLDYGATPKKQAYDFAKAWTKDKEREHKCIEVINIFDLYKNKVNESVRDEMTPKPKEDIVNDLKKLSPNKKLLVGYEYELLWLIKLGLEEGGEFSEHAGYLLMDFAKVNGREDIIQLLKDKGVDDDVDMSIINKVIPNRKVDESLRDKMTPKSKEDVREALLKQSDAKKLLMSIQYGYFDIFLEVYNACKRSIEEDKNTKIMIFMEACASGNYDVVKFMIEEGVDITTLDNKGLKLAKTKGYDDIVELLKYHSNQPTYESLRDKMTPKSKEHFNERLLKELNKDRALGYFNPSDWGLTLEDFYTDPSNGSIRIFIFHSSDGRRWKISLNDEIIWRTSFDYRYAKRIEVREIKKGVSSRVMDRFEDLENYLRSRGLTKKVNESLQDSLTSKPVEHIDNVHKFRRYNFIEPWAQHEKYRNHVGYIVIDDEYDDELYLSSFTIFNPYKGKGLGRKYLNIVLDDLKEFSQYHWIGLSVKRDNEVAIKLYRSVGFELADEVDKYNGYGKNYKNDLYYFMVKENK